MKPLHPVLNVDIVIIGGGIAGLWLLARLRQRGYGAVLIENQRLGVGQTLCAQGIIHGGVKYSLGGQIGDSAAAIAGMPEAWRRCLRGEGDLDLRAARLLADHQYLWTTRAPTSRLAAFFAGKLMQGRMEKIAEADAVEYPPALRHPRFRGTVYRLDEPIVDVASVLAALAEPHREAIILHQGPAMPTADGTFTLRYPGQRTWAIRPAYTVFTAGAGNAVLPWTTLQLRPLHMVMARGPTLLDPFYAHCLGASDLPRLTVTSHHDIEGRPIWYLGGGLAETGVERNRYDQIQATRRELKALLPWVDWSPVEFATFTVQRAEAHQPRGGRPAEPGICRNGRVLAVWPTKLAFAPLLAERVETLLHTLGARPRPVNLLPLANWPRPVVAVPPWDREDLEWS
ncbi:MAG: FAD-dependent oxidoreductase [Candidatus Contendobacter sp.]|nr:FAD-dependent oxidoreductase [Candidatus Contendobacter sp.]MDG4559046.1 FAD-dependent oxidoreductase [Candidatus Contendobacter sp.]